ncbi:MAG TPA: hypothetical protein VGP83_17170 [Pyrinomonadaceae bacterium]|jgi:Zn finger protein HypA/HybF involved in hydrogenase expression|nr:hypothetical protein [Pyrinomonadaceae bacterium]
MQHPELLVCAVVAFAAGVICKQFAKRLEGSPRIKCPHCGMISYHPQDIAHRYCGNCHRFHDDIERDQAAG